MTASSRRPCTSMWRPRRAPVVGLAAALALLAGCVEFERKACSPGALSCDGNVVVRCGDDGDERIPVETCGPGACAVDRCVTDAGPVPDTAAAGDAGSPGTPDAASPDAASPDAASPDTAAPDTAAPDTASPDAASPDTTTPDTTAPDTTAPDTTAPDAVSCTPAGCDDGDPCTDDGCDPAGSCTHTPNTGAPCDDGDGCTTGDQCAAGACEPGPAETCSSHGPHATCMPDPGACVGTMVLVPAGSFFMGCNAALESGCGLPEKPQHEVTLAAYEIDVTEVTVAAYAACVTAGACDAPISCNYVEPGKDAHPINCVSWSDAAAYCAWAGKRLCTEAEWERAARGGCELHPAGTCAAATHVYPWGDAPATCDLAVMQSGGKTGCGTEDTWPVGSILDGGSPYGALDMAGNVAEWTADLYAADYYCNGPDATCENWCSDCNGKPPWMSPWPNPQGAAIGNNHPVKGGSFNLAGSSLRAADRSGYSDATMTGTIGFRCCK